MRFTMSTPGTFAAQILTAGAPALAAAATELMLERDARAAGQFGPDAFGAWRDNLADRVRQLAAAISVSRPGIFQDQVSWARTAFRARGLDEGALRLSLECLRDVLDAETPGPVAEAARECVGPAIESFRSAAAEPPARLTAGSAHGRIGADFLLAVLEGDRRRASRVVLDAVRAGMPARDAYMKVLAPVQQELGRMWHMNEVTVAEEHFATATTRGVMAQLQPLLEIRPPNGRTVVAASVEGNAHDLGLQMVADFLEMDGWRVIFLGASVPAGDVAVGVEIFKADLLALGVNLATQIGSLEATIRAVRSSPAAGAKILVGGFIFQQDTKLWEELGADGAARDAEEAVAVGRRLGGLAGA